MHKLVRAFHPQSFPGTLVTNTNYPPQVFDESGKANPIDGLEGIGGTTDNIIWDDGVETGNLEYNETP